MKRLGIVIILILIFSSLTIFYTLFFMGGETSRGLSAVIIDNVSLDLRFNNETFRNQVKTILEQVNFSRVDYYGPNDVTIDLYRKLPSLGYNLILLRIHSSTLNQTDVCFFSSEDFSLNVLYSKYKDIRQYLVKASTTIAGENRSFFGVKPSFFKEYANGEFNGKTIIIAMGCDSLLTLSMAEAFISKKALLYLGWDGKVYPPETDSNTVIFLKRFFLENKTIKESVSGLSDKTTPAKLGYFPPELSNLKFNEWLGG